MEAVPVSSRIEAVTVYRQGARVTRVAEIPTVAGALPAAVRLGGLPLGVDDGSIRVRVGGAGDLPIAADVRVVLEVPPVDPIFTPIVATVPLQLLAYHVADLRGTDIDQPRNLAKSVTVE